MILDDTVWGDHLLSTDTWNRTFCCVVLLPHNDCIVFYNWFLIIKNPFSSLGPGNIYILGYRCVSYMWYLNQVNPLRWCGYVEFARALVIATSFDIWNCDRNALQKVAGFASLRYRLNFLYGAPCIMGRLKKKHIKKKDLFHVWVWNWCDKWIDRITVNIPLLKQERIHILSGWCFTALSSEINMGGKTAATGNSFVMNQLRYRA